MQNKDYKNFNEEKTDEETVVGVPVNLPLG